MSVRNLKNPEVGKGRLTGNRRLC